MQSMEVTVKIQMDLNHTESHKSNNLPEMLQIKF